MLFRSEAKSIIDADFPDLVANVQSDPRTITVMLNPDAHHADVMHDVITTDIVRRRYPHQPENVIQDVVTLFGARTELGRAVKEDPSVIRTMNLGLDEPAPAAGGQEPQDP